MKRIVLITGVLGGIGSATAKVFAEEGWHVIGVDRSKASRQLEIHHYIDADISDPQVPDQIIKEISLKGSRLNAIVNNAAIQICKQILETSIEEWDLTMATNIRPAFLLSKSAYPLLRKSGGAIVNISSVHARATSIGLAAYAASKAAISSFTRSMALEMAKDNIRVNSVLPGAIDTGMLRSGLKRGHIKGELEEKLISKLAAKHIAGRVGQPKEIAQIILFLADPKQSSFITGQEFVVDGGALSKLSTE